MIAQPETSKTYSLDDYLEFETAYSSRRALRQTRRETVDFSGI
ncbi:hypothetical protein XM38_009730 [Halomicronema hongdechloris C2206]|uniref:Uncharacterized protein n=1 Tax=Halomicronema hongdechloris C2206 TaxID=1641165 RepID=A0A1Z3HID9_9CYAN|nr:hypothetical protein XM38_009730 [Halomicronema hongdechloris C2206]